MLILQAFGAEKKFRMLLVQSRGQVYYQPWWFSINSEVKVAYAGCCVNNGGRVCCYFSIHEGIDSSVLFIDGITGSIFV